MKLRDERMRLYEAVRSAAVRLGRLANETPGDVEAEPGKTDEGLVSAILGIADAGPLIRFFARAFEALAANMTGASAPARIDAAPLGYAVVLCSPEGLPRGLAAVYEPKDVDQAWHLIDTKGPWMPGRAGRVLLELHRQGCGACGSKSLGRKRCLDCGTGVAGR